MRIKITLIFAFLIQVGFAQIEISAGPVYESFNFNGKSLKLIGARLQFGNPVFEENMTITLPVDYLKADTLSFIAIDPTFRYYFNDKAEGYFIGGSYGLLFNLESKFEDYISPLKLCIGYRQYINDNFFVDFSPFIGYQSSALKNYSVSYGANASLGISF
jgi:hypothetical protein